VFPKRKNQDSFRRWRKTHGQGLNFTAAEVGAQAAGLAAMEVLQTLKRPRHKIIKALLAQ
jgi:hypothetical protein